MNQLPVIRGAVKGEKMPPPPTPVEQKDTLQSSASVQILDLVCEGEIEGLAEGLQSIFLDETPIQNPDGTFNFSGLDIEATTGTQSQGYIPGNPGVEHEVDVSVQIKNGSPGPIIRTITNPNIDAVRILLSFPQMSVTQDDGSLVGSSVQFAIDVQSNGAGYVEKLNQTISGKCISKYQKSYRIDLSGGAPYDIRVRRISADETNPRIQNTTYWQSYVEIEDVKLTYPNSAVMSVKVKATQFSSIPARAYDLKMLKVRVPSNSATNSNGSLSYSGSWDGTFRVSWSTNPAWIFYDLLTSERYGLGGYIPESQVDKWALYSIGKYCDETVSNGFGGIEPRFSCNLYLQSRADAFKVMNDLASIFRGMLYWSGGTLTVSQDSPQDPIYLFNQANVEDGLFTYTGTSAKARHTVALVAWNNPDDFYRQKIEYVEDPDAIARFGVVETQVVAMGCTSRGQAHRLGRWILYTERYQAETVTFKTGLEGATLRPGQVIKIADPVRAGKRCGGRISSATTAAITVDGDIPLSFSPSLAVSALLPDGTVERRSVFSLAGRVINVTPAFSDLPQSGSIWLIEDGNIEPQLFRVVTITESSVGVFEILAIAHNPNKFDAIDSGTVLETQNISALTANPDSPEDLAVTETLYAVGRDVRVKITISWKTVPEAAGYQVQWRRDSLNVINAPQITTTDFEILSAEPGSYDFWIYSVSSFGKRSVASKISKVIRGKGLPPASVQNFSLIPQAGMAYLTWDQSEDLDVLIGGYVRIRYSPDTVTPAWKDSVDIVTGLAGNTTHATVPLLSGTYMAKFVDSSGVPSDDEATITTTVPAALALNIVDTLTESPSFAGAKTNVEYRPDLIGLVIASTTLVDDISDVDSFPSWDFLGGVESSGEYDFANSLDLGAVYTSRITAALEASALDVTDTIDQRLDNADDWLDIDGNFIDDVNAVLYVRTTNDDPGGSPTWTDWKPFFVGEYEARAMQFKLLMTSGNPSHSIVITNLAVTVDMPDRTVNMPGLTSGDGTYSVTFEAAFRDVPAIGISGHNLGTGDYFEITSKAASGFNITFKNAAGTAVSRTFDVIAKGYGRAS